MTRAEALDLIKSDGIYSQEVMDALEQTGHWEYGYAFADGNYCKCSECKEIIKCIYPMHYCPNCGARMIEPQESDNCN